ncbi:MAG: AMP-binding protein [Chloroflexi bacterium]|nr:AMP-binding protein [Chloroflexota bacterium]
MNADVQELQTSSLPGTIRGILDRGEPSHIAIISPDGPVLTYGDLKHQVDRLAEQLHSFGIGPGDRVAIILPNGVEHIVSFLAVTAAGATAAPLNPAYTKEEFRFCFEDANAKALISSTAESEAVKAALPDSMTAIDVGPDDDGQTCFTSGISVTEQRPVEPSEADDVALVLHTSGTTSRPKKVPLTHRNLVVSAQNIIDTYGLTADDVSLCVMPLFHIHGLVASTLATLMSGGVVVVPAKFNALDFWPAVEAHHVTWYSAVPTMHQALLHRAKRNSGSEAVEIAKRNLRFIRSCSAPFSPETLIDMEETFGVPVLEAYGMTEAAHQVASNPLRGGKRVPGSVGIGTNVSIAIMDQDGNIEPAGVAGEVVIKGENITQGYEDNPEANRNSFTDGWFRTGDQGVMDSEGYLKLVGRLKEIIIRSGEKISPQEIDETLLAHPSVAGAVAFGVPNSTHGEVPSAAVVLRSPVQPAELVAYCRAHLAAFKCPKVIHIVDEIPRSATGKVQRRVVSAAFA